MTHTTSPPHRTRALLHRSWQIPDEVPPRPAATCDRHAQLCDHPRSRGPLPTGEAIVWTPGDAGGPRRIVSAVPRAERRRHIRKYAEGELPPHRSFYFHGPEGKLNLRAQNLQMFLQLAEGVGEETWLHHLRRGDYSRWFREMIKDDELAQNARAVEAEAAGGSAAEDSLARIRALIEERYTAPA